MSPMFTLPEYDVVIWHRVASSLDGLADRLIARVGREPHEHTNTGQFEDFHWSFDSAEAATLCAESFFDIASLECVVYLVVTAYGDDAFGRKTYKDTRFSPAKNASAPR